MSGKHYIGKADVSHCTNIQIKFNDGEWKIHAEFRDKDGNIHADEKTYRRKRLGGELNEMPAANQTADNVKREVLSMYIKKLTEQLVLLEERQKQCTVDEVAELLALSKNILAIAKKLDELDQKIQTDTNPILKY